MTSRLVFLDVTVLSRHGQPVLTGLTKDDFIITEGKTQQRISSFEAPDVHTSKSDGLGKGSEKAPLTIFVLDRLNASFSTFASYQNQLETYVAAQPAELAVPSEIMILDNKSLQMLQGYTRRREDLLSTLHHLPAALSYKMNPAFQGERFIQSINALQQIALQNKGIAGRKNIVWLGKGAPDILKSEIGGTSDWADPYLRNTTDLLVNSRMTLFVLYAAVGLSPEIIDVETAANLSQSGHDPLSGGLSFGVFISGTGGKFFFNRNDVVREIEEAQDLGSVYYTLTYHPQNDAPTDAFTPIRVTMRDANLHAMTKSGYYSAAAVGAADTGKHAVTDISEAVQANVPFQNLAMTLAKIVRHPDTGTAEFTINLSLKDLPWTKSESGKTTASLKLAAACLTAQRGIASSTLEAVTAESPTDDVTLRAKYITRVVVTLRVPSDTESVRVVMQTVQGGRLGSVDIKREALDSAPATPTPEPLLTERPRS